MNELIEQTRWLDRRLEEILEAADWQMSQVSIPDIHALATSHFASYGECMDELKRVHGIAKLKATVFGMNHRVRIRTVGSIDVYAACHVLALTS